MKKEVRPIGLRLPQKRLMFLFAMEISSLTFTWITI